MQEIRQFAGATEAELWQQVAADMARQPDLFSYSALLQQGGHSTELVLDIDLGGGFEGGYSTTTLATAVPAGCPLRFALHDQNWMRELGKLLGMEDIELGYPALDETIVIKTNQPAMLRALLQPDAIRATLRKYHEAELTLQPTDEEDAAAPLRLQFFHEAAILNPAELQEIYHLLYSLAEQLSSPDTISLS